MSDVPNPVPASGDGVTILGGGQVLVDQSLFTADAPPAPAAPALPTPAEQAEEYLRANFSVYRDRDHPDHTRVVQEVRARFGGQAAPPATPHPTEPPVDAFRYAMVNKTSAEAPPPFVMTPELEAIAAAPTAKPPSLGPDDVLARVPATPAGYQLSFPRLPDEFPPWDQGAVKAQMHAHGLSSHQAQGVLNFYATRGVEMRQQAGDAELTPAQLGECVAFGKGIGLTQKQITALVDLLDTAPVPRVGKAPEELEARQLMADPANGYYDPEHPKNRQTRKRVHELFAKAGGQGPNYYRR